MHGAMHRINFECEAEPGRNLKLLQFKTIIARKISNHNNIINAMRCLLGFVA